MSDEGDKLIASFNAGIPEPGMDWKEHLES